MCFAQAFVCVFECFSQDYASKRNYLPIKHAVHTQSFCVFVNSGSLINNHVSEMLFSRCFFMIVGTYIYSETCCYLGS